MNIVLYHSDCTDGFTAAFLMHLYFKETEQEYELVPAKYNKPIEKDLTNKNVYIVDFSFEPKIVAGFANSAKSIVLLDHHLSAAKQYGGYGIFKDYFGDIFENVCPIDIRIQEEYSGAGLVYNYLRELETEHARLPFLHNPRIKDFVEAVQDYDLWRFALEDTKIYHELIQMLPRKIESWEEVFIDESDEAFYERLDISQHHYDAKQNMAERFASKHQIIELCGHRIPIVNSPAVFADRVCEMLYQEYPFAISFVASSEELYCSLRSKRGHGIDVSEIAQLFGGGGHKHSSAFRLPPHHLTKLLSGRLTPQPCALERVIDFIINIVEGLRFRYCR